MVVGLPGGTFTFFKCCNMMSVGNFELRNAKHNRWQIKGSHHQNSKLTSHDSHDFFRCVIWSNIVQSTDST